MVHLLPINFTPQASGLLNRLWVCTPFALQSHQTARTHYSYNPLYEGYHTLFQPGDCTSSLIMAAHKLVSLGNLGVKHASFIQFLGFAKQNPSTKQTMIDGEPCTIHMQEVACLDEATDGLIYGADGIVYFYNIALRSSFEQIQEQIHQKIKAASTPSAPDPATSSAASPPPFQRVLVGTVLVGTEREVSRKEGNELARQLGCDFFEVSEETEAIVEDVLHRIIRLCRQARKAEGDDMEDSWGNWGSCFGWR